MKLFIHISISQKSNEKDYSGFIPSSVNGVGFIELFFIDEYNRDLVYKITSRIPCAEIFWKHNDVLLVKKIDERNFILEKVEKFSFREKRIIEIKSELFGYVHKDNLHFTPVLFTIPGLNKNIVDSSHKLPMIYINSQSKI